MFSKQTCICLTTQSVNTVRYLRKRRHNRLSPWLCSEVNK